MKSAIAGFASLLLVGSLLAFPAPRSENDRSWVGKTVIMKRYGVQIMRTNDDHIDVVVGTLNRTDYVVVAERDDKIWVRQDGAEGWFLKQDATLPEEGIEFFTSELKKNANDTTLYAKRSKCYEQKGDTQAAIKDYDEALRIAPHFSSWWNNRGNLYMKLKNYDKALQDYDKALEISPASFIPLGNRGNAYNHKREYERAIVDYDEAIRQNAKYINAHANRGNSYRELRNFDKAMENYDAALEIDPKFGYAYANRAILWMRMHRLDKAEEDITSAVRHDSRSATVYLLRGNIRGERKDYRKAIEDYDHSLWLEPKSSEARAERGNARRELKQYDLAIKDYEEALKLEPKSVTGLTGKAWLLATCPDENFRDGTKALELATVVCELTKNKEPKALEALAAAHAELRQFDEAVKTQKKVLEISWYAKEKGDDAKSRLQQYENKKPYRTE
jgi:tetratricopeptide (TPR) repeat protein